VVFGLEVDVIYNDRFFRRRRRYAEQEFATANALVDAYKHLAYVVDVGCGTGLMLEQFKRRKIGVKGYEIGGGAIKYADESIKPDIEVLDFSQQQETGMQWELCLCIEVAEHIPGECAPVLCDNLARLTAPYGSLFFTAAIPGQRGHGHVNCQPQGYWVERFAACGMDVDWWMIGKAYASLRKIGDPRGLLKNFTIFKHRRIPVHA